MNQFIGNPGSSDLTSNVITLKEVSYQTKMTFSFNTKPQASHYAPTDIPIILEGSRAGSVARMLGVTGTTWNLPNIVGISSYVNLVWEIFC